jgi:hypothetical protein
MWTFGELLLVPMRNRAQRLAGGETNLLYDGFLFSHQRTSGLIYKAMGNTTLSTLGYIMLSRTTGFPLDFFPVLFAVPRVVGWVAHWRQVSLLPTIPRNILK